MMVEQDLGNGFCQKRGYGHWVNLLFWLFHFGVLIILRTAVRDQAAYIRAMAWWTFSCGLTIILHHFFVLKDKNWFSLPLLFYIPYWLIHYLIPIRILVDDLYVSSTAHYTLDDYWSIVMHIASLGIAAFMIGYSLVSRPERMGISLLRLNHEEKDTVRRAAVILLYASTASFVLFMVVGGSGLYGEGYVHVTHLGLVPGLAHLLFTTFMQAATCTWAMVYVTKAGTLRKNILPIFLLTVMTLSLIASGSRGLAALWTIGVLVVLTQKRVLSLLLLLAILFSASLFFAYVQKYRSVGEKSLSTAYVELSQEPFWPLLGLSQLSEAMAPTVTQTAAYVNHQGHMNGLFLAQDVLSIIPFYTRVFPFLPAAGSREMQNSGNFITYQVRGHFRSGLATTVVTDLYLNLPVPLVVLFMFLLGCFSGMLYNKRFCGRYLTGLLAYAVFFSGIVSSVRAPFFKPLRMVWAVGLYCIVLHVAGYRNKKRGNTGNEERKSCSRVFIGSIDQ